MPLKGARCQAAFLSLLSDLGKVNTYALPKAPITTRGSAQVWLSTGS